MVSLLVTYKKPVPTVNQLRKFLTKNGFIEHTQWVSGPYWKNWHPANDPKACVSQPLFEAASDYPRRVAEFLQEVADLEKITTGNVYDRIVDAMIDYDENGNVVPDPV